MRAAISRLLFGWRWLGRFMALAHSPALETEKWTPEDREALAKFLASEPGTKLAGILRQHMVWTTCRAVGAEPARLARDSYAALGFREALGLIDTLSEPLPSEGNNSATRGAQASPLRERLQA